MDFKRRSQQPADPFVDLAASWWDDSGVLHGLGVLLKPVRVPFVLQALRSAGNDDRTCVLDLGSGGGMLAAALEANGYTVTALDPSLLALDTGRRHSLANRSRVGFVCGTGEQLPFRDRSFDAVVCMEVLEHVADPVMVVAEAARVLRPGGAFVFSGPDRSPINRLALVKVAQDIMGLIPRGTHDWRRLLRPAEMVGLMRDAGIVPQQITGVGLRPRHVLGAAAAGLGLAAGRFTYPEAARRIRLSSVAMTAFAYQGYGIRAGKVGRITTP